MSLSRYKEALYKPLIDENPITLQILGICSALAVTNNLSTSIIGFLELRGMIIGSMRDS